MVDLITLKAFPLWAFRMRLFAEPIRARSHRSYRHSKFDICLLIYLPSSCFVRCKHRLIQISLAFMPVTQDVLSKGATIIEKGAAIIETRAKCIKHRFLAEISVQIMRPFSTKSCVELPKRNEGISGVATTQEEAAYRLANECVTDAEKENQSSRKCHTDHCHLN